MGCSKTDTEKRRRASEGKADAETVSIRGDLRVARNTKGRAGKRGRARAELPSCWERKAEGDHCERHDSHGLSGRATDQMCVAERTPDRAETRHRRACEATSSGLTDRAEAAGDAPAPRTLVER